MVIMKLSEEELNKLREVRIHSILGLADNGRKIFICCPFHGEKTPSLCIYPKNNYYCYGCQKSGQNALDFMVEVEGNFLSAIRELIKYI